MSLLLLLLFLGSDQQLQDEFRAHIQFLSHESLAGRDTTYPGQKIAAQYLISQLKLAGVAPKGTDPIDRYLQPFELWVTRLDELNVSATFAGKGKPFSPRLHRDFELYCRGEGPLNGRFELVYGGFGYSEPHFNELAGLDLKGKWVILHLGSPEPATGPSPFSERLPNLGLRKRFAMARMLGAVGGILVSPIGGELPGLSGPIEDMALEKSKEEPVPLFPLMVIRPEQRASILGKYDPQILAAEQRIRTTGKSASFHLRGRVLDFQAKLEQVRDRAENVIAWVPGREKVNEFLVISAHYDHIGRQGDEIFNGADDNAGGTTAVLKLAQHFQKNPCRRSLLFLFVSGEEHGLLGSEYFLKHPVVPKQELLANINLDMIGRNETGKIGLIPSTGKRVSTLNLWAERVNSQLPKPFEFIRTLDEYDERSDHFNFSSNGIPALFLFSGEHEDYHQASDDWDKLDFDKILRVFQLTKELIALVANSQEPIQFLGEQQGAEPSSHQ